MSCLFTSLSNFLEIDSYNIRQIICNYLEENNKIIDGLDTKFILSLDNPNYIQNMRHPNSWGGGPEIAASANIWKLKIVIHNISNGVAIHQKVIEFLPIDGYYRGIIHLTWNGVHFEALR